MPSCRNYFEMLQQDIDAARAHKIWVDGGRGGQHTNGSVPQLYTMLERCLSSFLYLERTIKHALETVDDHSDLAYHER
jgi:hypothetical protein